MVPTVDLRTRFRSLLVPGLCCLALGVSCDRPEREDPDLVAAQVTAQVAAEIRRLLVVQAVPASLGDGSPGSTSSTNVRALYEQRDGWPIWSRGHELGPQALELLDVVAAAAGDGLEPAMYLAPGARARLVALAAAGEAQPGRIHALAKADLLLTRVYLTYGGHLLRGRIDPRQADLKWRTEPRRLDLAGSLTRTVNGDGVAAALSALAPAHPGYAKLRRALADYRALQASGGWPLVPEALTAESAEDPIAISLLRARLAATGDLAAEANAGAPSAGGPALDPLLEDAVRRFQKRHGLPATGRIDPETLAQMNLPIEERIRQIEWNLERWRWLPERLGERHLAVNIPDFSLQVVEAGVAVESFRVVVGKTRQQTPVFSDLMTYLELNPYWNVPAGILRNEILPAVRKDPDYLRQEGMEVLAGWGEEAAALRPEEMDWSSLHPGRIRVRQRPGGRNALGRIKFVFPNRFDVYLHDTPAVRLFARSERALSHGCVRVDRPVDLAVRLLGGDPAWSRERITKAVATGERRVIRLPQPVPVHLLYWTAWVDDGGELHFREDLYGGDRAMARAVRRLPRLDAPSEPEETAPMPAV